MHRKDSYFSIKQIIINSMWYGIVPKLPSLINVILLPFITPFLTPWDYGIWGTISAYSELAIAICCLGLNVHLTNSYYEYKTKYYLVWGRISFLIHVISIIISLILVFILWFSLKELSISNRILTVFFSIFPSLFYTNQLLASHLYPLRAEPRQLVIRNFIASMCGMIVLFVSVVYFNAGYMGFVLNSAISAIIGYFLFLKPLWIKEKIAPIFHNRVKRIKSWFIIALPVIPHALGFALLSSATRIIMSLYNVDTSDMGLFTNGVTMGSYVIIITSALASSLAPKMQESYRRKDYGYYRNLFYISQIITFTCILLCSIWMKDIYSLLIRNQELKEAYSIAQVICFANIIYPFYHFTSAIITIEKKTQYLLWLVFVPGILCIISNVILLPIYGYKSAVYSSILSYWSQFLIPFFVPFIREKTKLWLGSTSKLLILFGLSIVSVALILIGKDMNLFLKILISIIFIVVSSLALWRINTFLNSGQISQRQ